MRIGKCQCTIYKEQYGAFLRGEVDEETKAWMELHKSECAPCREWSKTMDSVSGKVAIDSLNSVQGDLKTEKTEESNDANKIRETNEAEAGTASKNSGKAFMAFGFGVIVFAAVLVVRFISS